MGDISERKYKILIVDDSDTNRAILTEILSDEYDITEADSGGKAIEILQENPGDFSLVLLDVIMPEMDGYEVLVRLDRLGILEDLPVIMISAESSPGFITKAYDLGASDYVSRPFESTVVQRRVKNTITLYAKHRRLLDIVADQIYEKEKNNNLMISILSHIVEFRNGESGSHVIHINIITEQLLKQLIKKTRKYNLSMTDIRLISTASSLHDIGKIAIPDEILNKPGRFTPEEYEIMKTHSEIGASMLKNLTEYQNEPLMKASYEICRWHHERYDGRGYPDGLKGDEIPISAQVVSIADVYDALTSERCYKKAYSHEKAIEMICGGECGAFNPLIIECLMEISDYLAKELRTNSSVIKDKKEMQKVTDEILNNNDLAASGQMLQQLEFERGRSAFFESELSDVYFSFQSNPPVLSLSSDGAKQFGISRVISDPLKNAAVMKISDGSAERIKDRAAGTSAEEPSFEMDGHIMLDDKLTSCRLSCKTLWIPAEYPIYIGLVGKINFS